MYEVVAGADPRRPTGKGTLFIDGAEVGQGTIDRTIPGMFSVSEPFDVGVDNGGSVDRSAYTSPFRFSDTLELGAIRPRAAEQVAVERGGAVPRGTPRRDFLPRGRPSLGSGRRPESSAGDGAGRHSPRRRTEAVRAAVRTMSTTVEMRGDVTVGLRVLAFCPVGGLAPPWKR